jgi:hypothetical protein
MTTAAADDDEDFAAALIASGAFTAEDLVRHGVILDQGDKPSAPESAALAAPAEQRADSSSPEDINAELDEISRVRRADLAAWFKNDALQARERELLELREHQRQAGADPDRPDLDPKLLAEWEDAGGIDAHLAIAQKAAGSALNALGGEDRTALQDGFDGLPAGAQTQVIRFLGITPGGNVRPASDAALEAFAQTEEGAELVTEWRGRAAQKLGAVRGRMDLMLSGMSDADRAAAEQWFNALPAKQAAAVLRALAG